MQVCMIHPDVVLSLSSVITMATPVGQPSISSVMAGLLEGLSQWQLPAQLYISRYCTSKECVSYSSSSYSQSLFLLNHCYPHGDSDKDIL